MTAPQQDVTPALSDEEIASNPRDGATEGDALPLVRDLFRSLNVGEIRYCHWKSNLGLAAALRGETDLDLLVDSRDAQRFREILGRYDCKLVLSDPTRLYPGLEDWLGLDASVGRLIHLHIHYRLVLGEQFVKNYSLPLERAFLVGTDLRHGVKVPAPEMELIVLVLRAMLKYRNRDLLRDLLGRGRSGIPPAILQEIRHLRSQTSDAQVTAALRTHVAFIDPILVFDFLRALDSNPRAGWKFYGLRRRVRRELSPFQRYSRLRARAIYYRRMLARTALLQRLFSPLWPVARKRKTPASGGLTVAIVGVDGAGKSTVVREIARFLAWRLTTRRYYMGSSKATVIRASWKAAARLERLARPTPVRGLATGLRELILALRYLADAHSRQRNYWAGRRAAAGGAVVIFDRFPLEAIQIKGHAMDGPRIAWRHAAGNPGSALRSLAEREGRLYRRILLPDLLIVLHVSPETATARKPDHAPEKLAAKCHAVSAVRRAGLPMVEVNADRPLADVLHQVKVAIWQHL